MLIFQLSEKNASQESKTPHELFEQQGTKQPAFFVSRQDALKPPAISPAQKVLVKYDLPSAYLPVIERALAEDSKTNAEEVARSINRMLQALCKGIGITQNYFANANTGKERIVSWITGQVNLDNGLFEKKDAEKEKLFALDKDLYHFREILQMLASGGSDILKIVHKLEDKIINAPNDKIRSYRLAVVHTDAFETGRLRIGFPGLGSTDISGAVNGLFVSTRLWNALNFFENLADKSGQQLSQSKLIEKAKKMEEVFMGLGICYVSRHSPESLIDTFRVITEKGYYKPGDNLTIIVYPVSDWNTSFNHTRHIPDSIIKESPRNHILLCVARSGQELQDRLLNFGFLRKEEKQRLCVVDGAPSYDNGVFLAHGTPTGMAFSDELSVSSAKDMSPLLRGVFKGRESNIFLISCSTGVELAVYAMFKNIANTLQVVTGATVFAATASTAALYLSFDEMHRPINIAYMEGKTRVYTENFGASKHPHMLKITQYAKPEEYFENLVNPETVGKEWLEIPRSKNDPNYAYITKVAKSREKSLKTMEKLKKRFESGKYGKEMELNGEIHKSIQCLQQLGYFKGYGKGYNELRGDGGYFGLTDDQIRYVLLDFSHRSLVLINRNDFDLAYRKSEEILFSLYALARFVGEKPESLGFDIWTRDMQLFEKRGIACIGGKELQEIWKNTPDASKNSEWTIWFSTPKLIELQLF